MRILIRGLERIKNQFSTPTAGRHLRWQAAEAAFSANQDYFEMEPAGKFIQSREQMAPASWQRWGFEVCLRRPRKKQKPFFPGFPCFLLGGSKPPAKKTYDAAQLAQGLREKACIVRHSSKATHGTSSAEFHRHARSRNRN